MQWVVKAAAALATTALTAETLPVVVSDVLVVGAGAAGLSVALEAGRRGASIAVVDLSSVFGGHVVMSEGGLSLVGTPLQQSKGIIDTPEQAIKDFTEWGKTQIPHG
jgi:succinate dehydrogenase/fumarate reductase flavoprotein subunit